MIILVESGRLGNQLFQYNVIREGFNKEKIIFFGFSNLKELLNFKYENLIQFDIPNFVGLKLATFICRGLIKLRLVGGIFEIKKNRDKTIIQKRRGLIPFVFILSYANFQNTETVKSVSLQSPIKDENYELARNWIKEKFPDYQRSKTVFIHIRRGDYVNWPTKEFPAVLGIDWYKRAIDSIIQKVDNPNFIIVTDDIYYAQDLFKDQNIYTISNNSQIIDLSIMSQCGHGILSASSFAWWGAHISSELSTNMQPIFLAPKYWCGHRKKQWLPDDFISDFLTYIE